MQTRRQFPSLWRKSLDPAERRELLAHLSGCRACDHAFRRFALTAPVLHANPANSPRVRANDVSSRSSVRLNTRGWFRRQSVSSIAAIGALAIGVAIAAYLTVPRRVTFVDLIAGYFPSAPATYSPTDNLFWPEGSKPRAKRAHADSRATSRRGHKHVAS